MAWQIIPSITGVAVASLLSMISRRRMISIIAAECFDTREESALPFTMESATR